MNHSVRFWKVVEAELPDYQARRALLRQYERRLMTETEV
jgi:predicted metal-dependent hydrolase